MLCTIDFDESSCANNAKVVVQKSAPIADEIRKRCLRLHIKSKVLECLSAGFLE